MSLPVTVCIPVLNEERHLPSCLEALDDDFEAVVVVDSGSTDGTRRISEAAGATVLDFQWDGRFPKKRNWVLRNHSFTTPWVLFLDADERVTPAFVEELRRTLAQTSCAGFRLSFDNWFMGQQLKHGDVMCKLPLFRIGTGEYERIPEDSWSQLDMEVHEHPIIEGAIGEISARLEHHGYHGAEHFLARHEQYADWEAARCLWLRRAGPGEWSNLNRRQHFKYSNLDRWWLAWCYFLTSFFMKQGFLDGVAGWRFARLKMRYFQRIRLKIRRIQDINATAVDDEGARL